ncbi:iron-siderophore ABC transporter substrate-binding protein [Microbacterium sp.]|uniref:iron-siderophore ABC transporter substrate-binding protein n=1 Tax=Microbacterium sp. TaxID=51671 RepID=UPI0039E60B1B
MRLTRILGAAAAATLVAALAACSSSAPEETTSAESDGAFPVTIEHVYGETIIESKPERVATVAWANQEVPLALGIVPVGMAKVTWGDDDHDGVLPWVEDKLTELGADTPVLFDETDGIDFEAVADTEPDVILAASSGITEDEYETLSKIAPVVAYPGEAWGTSLEDMIALNSTALGEADAGAELIDDLHAQITAALDENSALKDKKVLFAFFEATDLSQIGFYTPIDTRPGFLLSIGLPAPAVLEEYQDSTEFYTSISAEQADELDDVDIIATYGDDTTLATLQADPLLSKIPAIAEGRVAILENDTPLAASANPSPLSIGWGIGDYFALLASPLQG